MANANGTPETPQNLPPDVGQPQGPAYVPPGVEPSGPLGRENDPKARMWAMFCHLAAFAGVLPVVPGIGCLLGPLVVWLIKKNEFPFVDEQGKEALNFQITMFIYGVVAGLLMLLCIGFILVLAVAAVDVVLVIMAAIKVNDGYHYRYPYPLIIRFIK
jgi:hypothetical protein